MTKTIPLFELKKIQTNFIQNSIRSTKDSCEYIRQFYLDDINVFESAFILLLNNANTTIGYAKISQGGITGTVVDPRLIAKYAVESLAVGVILAHNHPSGNLMPSLADKTLTNKVKEGLKYLDINLLDHIILTQDGYYSMMEEGDI